MLKSWPQSLPWHHFHRQHVGTIYTRSVTSKEISALPEKQQKEGADERGTTRGAVLQGAYDQSGDPKRSSGKDGQARPVHKRSPASLEARRHWRDRNTMMQ